MKDLVIEAKKQIEQAKDLRELDAIFKCYFGKNGEIAKIFESLKNLPEEARKKVGKEANEVKKAIEEMFQKKRQFLKNKEIRKKTEGERLDITRPGKKSESGHLHPLSIVGMEVNDIFTSMGFEIAQGPEIESEWYNFDALNIPKEHPARDAWDTFWIDQGVVLDPRKNFLLRTHTSPVQIRYMESHNPPLKIIAPGRVFRYEAADGSHEINFYQVEGLMVNKQISVANFKAVIEEFLKRFFKSEDIKIRLRPSFFPFTEPSFEIDVKRDGRGWLELMGAGMVHPNVFKAAGYVPKHWTGFAFGFGLDRLAMLKYKINDIRLFYNGDLRFLRQF